MLRERSHVLLMVCASLLAGCGDDAAASPDAASRDAAPDDVGPPMDVPRRPRDAGGFDRFLDAEIWSYEWTCTGVAPPGGEPLATEPPVEDCSAGVWPDLDALMQ